jgi:hypothetical protein
MLVIYVDDSCLYENICSAEHVSLSHLNAFTDWFVSEVKDLFNLRALRRSLPREELLWMVLLHVMGIWFRNLRAIYEFIRKKRVRNINGIISLLAYWSTESWAGNSIACLGYHLASLSMSIFAYSNISICILNVVCPINLLNENQCIKITVGYDCINHKDWWFFLKLRASVTWLVLDRVATACEIRYKELCSF